MRTQPRQPSSRGRATERDACSDSRQPGPKGTFAAPARQRTERDHEGLLCSIFSLGQVAHNSVARPHEARPFELDQKLERVPVSTENGIDGRAGDRLGRPILLDPGGCSSFDDRS